MNSTTDSNAPEECTQAVFRIASEIDAERIAAIRRLERAVLVFGPGASPANVTTALDALARFAPDTVCSTIVLAAKEETAGFQKLIDADRLFYLAAGELSQRDLNALIEGALARRRPDPSLDRLLSADHLRRLALAQSVSELAGALRAAAGSAAQAERVRCVLYDPERKVLWAPSEAGGDESTAAGLVGFIHRTGMTVCLPRLGEDPRLDFDLDNPGGEPSDRFLGVPVRAGGTVLAVLVALRPVEQRAFEPREIAMLEAIAAHASPYVASWLGEIEGDSPYRHRALRELEQPMTAAPEPLRLDPRWTRHASWFALAAFIALLLALLLSLAPAVKGWLHG